LLTWTLILVLMAAFGVGVNRYLAIGSTTAFALQPRSRPRPT